MALLIGPKLMGAIPMIRGRTARRTCGGGLGLGLSVLAEIALSALIAPVLMLMQARAMIQVLRKPTAALSITPMMAPRDLCAQLDVGQAAKAAPDDSVSRRRVSRPCEVPT